MPTSVELRTRVRFLWLESSRGAEDFDAWTNCNWPARMALALADAFERQGGAFGATETPLPFFLTGPGSAGRPRPPSANDR